MLLSEVNWILTIRYLMLGVLPNTVKIPVNGYIYLM